MRKTLLRFRRIELSIVKNKVYSYEIDGKLYINLTNKCTNACEFCVRNKDSYEGYYLWLEKEPDFDEVVSSIKDIEKYSEIVFCGYGEPTERVDVLIKLGKYFKSLDKKTRLNTNGHGDRINGRALAKELVGAIDVVSVSLNQTDEEKYDAICHCIYGKEGFDEMLKFTESCVKEGLETYMSVVKVDGVDVEKAAEIAKKCGAKLKVREYIDVK